MTKPIIFSGIQPSGKLMLGNYLGALRNWVKLQNDYECLYCLVDMHAITMKQDPAELRERSYEGLAIYIASGVDPKNTVLFLQSQVHEHAELAWILLCNTYMGELNRMTQFKDKTAKAKNIGVGLFTYPSLMAADILLYQTNLVPVGQDQKQHLELARDLAIRMNNTYGELFKVPEVFIPPVGARIMSLQDPLKKMSKSDEDATATVFLSDSDDVILKKIKRAVTDSGTEIAYDPTREEKAGVTNLIAIQAAITGKSPESIVTSYAGKQYGHLKVDTAQIVVECLRPLRDEYQRLLRDRGELDRIFAKGAEAAQARAETTMKKVREAVGFLPRR